MNFWWHTLVKFLLKTKTNENNKEIEKKTLKNGSKHLCSLNLFYWNISFIIGTFVPGRASTAGQRTKCPQLSNATFYGLNEFYEILLPTYNKHLSLGTSGAHQFTNRIIFIRFRQLSFDSITTSEKNNNFDCAKHILTWFAFRIRLFR